MNNWTVFLTATNAEPKDLSKAFLLLQDFEFTQPIDQSPWVLLTSSELPDRAPKHILPPIQDIGINNFAGASFNDINKFIRSNESKLQALGLTKSNWVIIDQKGIDTSTCLVVEQVFDGYEMRHTDEFRAARLPYAEAWSLFANLDIANTGFEEWVDEDAGVQEDGAYKWVGPFPPSNEHQVKSRGETEAKREAALKAMRDLGHID